jgi:tetratricopeptide (TPR) repeat protein
MWHKTLSLLMILLFAGCGHLFIEKQPIPKKEILPPKIVVKERPKKVIQKPVDTLHQQAKKMVQTADTLFFEGKYPLAYSAYAQTLRIDPDNIPATIGLAKCFLKEKKHEQAFSTLVPIEDRVRLTRYAPEYYYLYVQARATTRSRWNNIQLKKIEDAYYHALPAYRKHPDLYYYMGLIYQKIYKFNQAKTYFSKVVSYGGHYKENAYENICKIKELEQCDLCGYQQKLPLIPQISRADMCYILHHDLNIHELFQNITSDNFKPQPLIAMDIADHSLKQEIETVLLINLLGLSLFPNNSFEPEMPLTRADFAQIIFEIVNRIDPQAVDSVDFKKISVGLSDVHSSQRFFRAILFCTSQLIMSPLETGEFDPYGTVSGADALMSIRTLKQLFVQQFM